MPYSGNRYATAKRLRRHHGSKALWWAEEYATANRGTKYGEHWAAVHDILKRAGKKNPPKAATSLLGIVAAWVSPTGVFYPFNYGQYSHDDYAKAHFEMAPELLEDVHGYKRFHKGCTQGVECVALGLVLGDLTDRPTDAQVEACERWYYENGVPLPSKRNPPKLDRVVVRYAERVYRDLLAAIENGTLKPKVIQEPNLSMNSVKGEWLYKLQMEYRPIDLTVCTWSIGGRTFVPDKRKKPVEMVVKGSYDGIPHKDMFIHEFAHYLQAKHGIQLGTTPHASVADYLDAPVERDAYFIQFVSDFVNPLLARIAKKADPAAEFDHWFGDQKKITQRVKIFFSRSGLWQEMKPQTRKHHVERLAEYIDLVRNLKR
jgi:hypothetical protein